MKNLKIQCNSITRKGHAIERAFSAFMLGQMSQSEYCSKVSYLLAE